MQESKETAWRNWWGKKQKSRPNKAE